MAAAELNEVTGQDWPGPLQLRPVTDELRIELAVQNTARLMAGSQGVSGTATLNVSGSYGADYSSINGQTTPNCNAAVAQHSF